MCVECLEKIASTMEKVEQGGRTILTDDVWKALQSRCYVGAVCISGQISGFRALPNGGGRWTLACPLCVTVELKPPTPRVPMTLSGQSYPEMPPKLHMQWKGLRAPLVFEYSDADRPNACQMPLGGGLIVYEQLVGDDEAANCFKCMPAIGVYVVFWQPPRPAPDVDGLNIRILHHPRRETV